MDNVSLALLTCDRPELFETVASIESRLHGPITEYTIYVDGCSLDRVREIESLVDAIWRVVSLSDESQGYVSAMRSATAQAAVTECHWLNWWEDDFRLLYDLDLADMAAIMETDPQVAQVCCKRQPVWPGEIAAGNIFWTDDFEQRDGYVVSSHYWTANPSLMPTWVYRDNPWPEGAESEKAFGDKLYPQGDYVTATLGYWDDPPRIEHLAGKRTNVGY